MIDGIDLVGEISSGTTLGHPAQPQVAEFVDGHSDGMVGFVVKVPPDGVEVFEDLQEWRR